MGTWYGVNVNCGKEEAIIKSVHRKLKDEKRFSRISYKIISEIKSYYNDDSDYCFSIVLNSKLLQGAENFAGEIKKLHDSIDIKYTPLPSGFVSTSPRF